MCNFKKWFWRVDKTILFSILIMQLLGLLVILRLSYFISVRCGIKNDFWFFFKHLIFILMSNFFIFIFSNIKFKDVKKIIKVLYVIMQLLTLSTVVIGVSINGVKRWILFSKFFFYNHQNFLKY